MVDSGEKWFEMEYGALFNKTRNHFLQTTLSKPGKFPFKTRGKSSKNIKYQTILFKNPGKRSILRNVFYIGDLGMFLYAPAKTRGIQTGLSNIYPGCIIYIGGIYHTNDCLSNIFQDFYTPS